MPNITSIPAPRVPFIDERTGLMAREWYRFFLNLFVLTGSGSNDVTIPDVVNELRLRSTAVFLEDLEPEQGEMGIRGLQGIQGPAGQSIPGMDGEDGDELSMLGVYHEDHSSFGEMTITANGTATTLTLQNTYYKQTAGWVAGDLDDFTFSTDTLTSQREGNFFTACTFCATCSAANQLIRAAVFQNGSLITEHLTRFKFLTGTDQVTATLTGVVANVGDTDTFDLRLYNETSAGQTVTISDANFCLVRI